MSTRYSLGRRTPALNSLFAGLACAITLALTAGPAFAQSALDRVEINGRVFEAPTRYDVLESCNQADEQLQQTLLSTWFRERLYGTVDVQFVVTDGEVQAAMARGVSFNTALNVRRAVRQLQCTGAQPGTSIYRMQVVFVDANAPTTPGTAVAAGPAKPYVLALSPSR